MRRLGRGLASMLAVLALATSAGATTLYSVPLSGAAGHLLACRVTNASNTARDILVEILLSNGTVTLINSNGGNPTPAGGFLSATVGGNFILACRVTVDGGKNTVRAMFSVEKDVGGPDFVTILAVPME